MTYAGAVVSFLFVALWAYTLVDIVTTPNGQARHFSKWLWFALAVIFAIGGIVAWFLLGRPRKVPAGVAGAGQGTPGPVRAEQPPGAVRRRRPAPVAPDDDPEFLRRLGEIAEFERQHRDDEDPPTAKR